MQSIIRKELKLLRKGKGNLFFLIVMPMLFIVLFGSVFSGVGKSSLTIRYVDQDQSSLSKSFMQAVGHVNGFVLKQDTSTPLDEQIQEIKNGKNSALVVIPKGFGAAALSGKAQAHIRIYHDPTADSVTGPIETVFQSVANQYQQQHLSAALRAAGQTSAQIHQVLQPPIDIQEVQESSDTSQAISMVNQVVPGYTVMFVFFIIMSMMRSFLGEKESGMLARLRSTPMKPMTYLVGMWIPNILAVLIQCVVLLGFGHFAYHVNLGDIGAMSLIVLALGISGTGIGLAVSLLIRGENQGRAITMLISLGGAAVGGVWLPTQFMPHFIQVIGHFTPQYWAQQGFQDVMLRGAHIADVWQALAVLMGFGVAGLLVALWRFKHFLQTATN